MIGDILQPTHLLFILVIALLVLGPKRLPEVGRSLGRGLRDFRNAMSGDDDEPADALPAQTPTVHEQSVAVHEQTGPASDPTVASPEQPAVAVHAAGEGTPPAGPAEHGS